MAGLGFSVPPLETGAVAMLALGLGIFWALGFFGMPALNRGRRWFLLCLRAAGFLLLALLLVEPIVERKIKKSGVPLAIVLDRSESMSVQDGAAEKGRTVSRWNAAVNQIAEIKKDIEKDFSVLYYTLDKDMRPIAWEQLSATVSARGAVSDLAKIVKAAQDYSDVRGILLFSDGHAGGGRDPVLAVSRLGLPVYTVGAGRNVTAPDLVLDSVRAPHFAFKNADVEVTARVLSRHFTPESLTVSLVQNGRTLASQKVDVSSATGAVEVPLVFRPRFTGIQTYEVRTPVYRNEVNRRNNSRSFTLDVSRDRVRVLYICGKPGPNYSYLRHQLKANPTVELVTFVILRDPQDAVGVPDQELSLIPFPAQDTLFEQLPSFDVVIFEEFNFSYFGISGAGLSALREYVHKGGGLLLIGSSKVFGPQGPYRATPLEELLPVSPSDFVENGPNRFTLDVFEPDHPLMALDKAANNRQKWEDLSFLEGDGLFPSRIKPGAVALGGSRSPGRPALPLLAVWPRGKGRVFMLMSLTTWRWALQEAGRGNGPWVYQRFWSNAMHWLSSAEDFRLVRIDLPVETIPLGRVLLRVMVRDAAYRPLSTAQVRVSIREPGGRVRPVSLPSAGDGEYADSIEFEQAGTYRIVAEAYNQHRKWGQDERLLRLGIDWEENRDTEPDFSVLSEMSNATGGTFTPLEEFDSSWFARNTETLALTSQKEAPVSDSAWLLALLSILLLSDWYLRRRWGEV